MPTFKTSRAFFQATHYFHKAAGRNIRGVLRKTQIPDDRSTAASRTNHRPRNENSTEGWLFFLILINMVQRRFCQKEVSRKLKFYVAV